MARPDKILRNGVAIPTRVVVPVTLDVVGGLDNLVSELIAL